MELGLGLEKVCYMLLFHLSGDDKVTKSQRLCDRKLEVVSLWLLLLSEPVVTVGLRFLSECLFVLSCLSWGAGSGAPRFWLLRSLQEI